jgi:hypothetical protein
MPTESDLVQQDRQRRLALMRFKLETLRRNDPSYAELAERIEVWQFRMKRRPS